MVVFCLVIFSLELIFQILVSLLTPDNEALGGLLFHCLEVETGEDVLHLVLAGAYDVAQADFSLEQTQSFEDGSVDIRLCLADKLDTVGQ